MFGVVQVSSTFTVTFFCEIVNEQVTTFQGRLSGALGAHFEPVTCTAKLDNVFRTRIDPDAELYLHPLTLQTIIAWPFYPC